MSTRPSPLVTDDPGHAELRDAPGAHVLAEDLLAVSGFVNTYALATRAGLVLVDPGLERTSADVHAAVRAWSDAPVHTAVYTHGHVDHACGLGAFLEAGERPEIVAHENCPRRFQRYLLTHGLNARINQRQFGTPRPLFPARFELPTLTFRDALAQRVGDLELRYRAAQGETDDACYVWVPARGYLFTGDLVIWRAPNCGNPQKVQRYPVEWAEALRAMAALEAEWLLPGHGLVVRGREAVRALLLDTARYLEVIIEQVLTRLNAGETPEAIFHAVEPDPELATRPYLQARYDHPKFIVRNLLRLWGGWWNGNAADLLPATWAAQAAEVAALAGGVGALVDRGRKRLGEGDLALAAHLAEWATRAAPGAPEAQALKRDVYDRRAAEAEALMARGIFRAAANDARQALGEPPVAPRRPLSLG